MINGIINVKKEKGFTSHDVVAKLRGILKQKKIGHTGTLDPDAEGVLPICLGKGTRVCQFLTDEKKTYVAGLLLGRTTDTQDTSGKTILERSTDGLTEQEVLDCIDSFQGEQMQIPPMYSARKINGKKLYELARQGKEVEREARAVTFYSIQVVEINLPHVIIEVTCSKGTYIRTLCYDIGEKLGVGGCMESLVRTRVGRFVLEDAMTLDEIEADSSLDYVHGLEEMFEDLDSVYADSQYDKALYNGNSIYMESEFENKTEVRMYNSKREFIGIYRYDEMKKGFDIVKMFYPCDRIS